MKNGEQTLFSPSLQNVAHGLLICVIITALLKLLAPLLQPLFMAIFIHFISMPAVHWLMKRRVPASVAYGVTLILILGVFIGFGWSMTESFDELMRQLPVLQERFKQFIARLHSGIAGELPFIGRRLKLLADEFDFAALVETNFRASVQNFLRFISASLLTIFYLIFVIYEKNILPKRLQIIYGKERARDIQEVALRINDSIVEYLYVKFLASLITAVLAIIVMLFYGLKLPFLWGSILFFANFIPYLGSIVAFMLPIGFGFLQFTNPWTVVSMAVIFTLIDTFVGNLWEPRYAGYKLNLSPLAIMLALAFWGWLWGFIGILLAVPIMVSIKFVLENIRITQSIAVLISHE